MLLTWNQIFEITARAFGVSNVNLVHVPSEVIARYDADWGASLLGDKMYSVIFDNSKIKSFVPDFNAEIPFSEGVKDLVEWYKMPENQQFDKKFDSILDSIVEDWG